MEKLTLLILFAFVFILSGLLIAFGGFFVRLGMAAQAFDRRIAADGADGQAEVTDHRIVRGRKGTRSYYITFAYTVNALGKQPETFSPDTSISAEDYERLNPGDKVAIRYLPNEPKEVILLGGVHEQTVPFFLNGGIVAIVAGAVLIVVDIIGIVAWLRLRSP